MEQLSVEVSNYEAPHIWGGARCCESHEQGHSWSHMIDRDFVWCHTVPLPGPSTPSPSGACTVKTTLNHGPNHTARQNSIHISASLQLISFSNNTLIYIFHHRFIDAFSLICILFLDVSVEVIKSCKKTV
jgi:hypothetical protein